MSIFFLLSGILLAGCAAVVLLTAAILWYEEANRNPALLEDRFRADRLRFAFRYLGAEILSLLLTILARPVGWVRWGEQKERDEVFGQEPVILLHGLFHNRGCWWWTALQLRRHGFLVFPLNLQLWQAPELAVEALASKVEELIALGAERVHLVGHSMGGLIARAYLRRPERAARVGRCILLGTPNAGSRLAPLAVSPTGLLLLSGSEYLREFREDPLPDGVRLTAIYSRHDNLVIPGDSGRLEGAHNIELTELGHTTLLYDPVAVETVIAELTG